MKNKLILLTFSFLLSFSIYSNEERKKTKIVSRKVLSFYHYKKGVQKFSKLVGCTKNKKDLVAYKKCITSNLDSSVRPNRRDRIARWLLFRNEFKEAYVCSDETLDSFPPSSNPNYILVLCFDFTEEGNRKVGVIYYTKDRGALKINGLQY